MNPRFPSFFKRALLATALLGTGHAVAADSVGLVVYNAQHETLTKAWVAGFTEETGIPVTIRNGDDTEMGNQLVQEGAASPADVFLTENSPAMVLVDNAKLFRRWRPRPLSKSTLPTVRPTAIGSASLPVPPCSSTTRTS
jgi:iron(III) transport system substrate-binding protein